MPFSILLGAGAFETISGEVVKGSLFSLNVEAPTEHTHCVSIDVSEEKTVREKSYALKGFELISSKQRDVLLNPDYRLVIGEQCDMPLLDKYADSKRGIVNGDNEKWLRRHWELPYQNSNDWKLLQSSTNSTCHYSGREMLIDWSSKGRGMLRPGLGNSTYGQKGIALNRMGGLPVTIYTGELYDQNAAVVVPNAMENLTSSLCYSESPKLCEAVRKIDKKVGVTPATFLKIPFDINYWNNVAEEQYPNGLPDPYTNDPIQWIFHGHPCGSVIWDEDKKWTATSTKRIDNTVLQVATARILGYRWPAELDKEMELAEEMRHWVAECDELLDLVDDDGIVCLPAIRGEQTAANRLEAMLQAAYGEQWSAKVLHDLLESVGSKSLETWLRDKFFEQHCKLFQHRPFVWQIWDGLKDGFSVLVNYHQLDYKGLERLIYTYLGEWIGTQEHGVKEGIDGADNRLMAAKNLKTTLEAILKGEAITGKSGLDIFVRWKPLHEQPMGWNPDLNDGVRMNIRPFMQAPKVGVTGAGVLRKKPNIKWNKDRGNDVVSAPWYYLGLEYGEKEGARINDHHVSLKDKQKARESIGE